jgi:predicted RNase H-like HicB family nuclease
VDGADNFPTRYLVNDACVLLGKPNVYGSIFRFEGQATVFAYEGGPCYRCLYPKPQASTETGRAEMNKYTVFFEQTATGYSAHVPDLPGCVAAGGSLAETRQLIREAIEFHIEAMRLHGEAVPEPTKHIEQVEIPA